MKKDFEENCSLRLSTVIGGLLQTFTRNVGEDFPSLSEFEIVLIHFSFTNNETLIEYLKSCFDATESLSSDIYHKQVFDCIAWPVTVNGVTKYFSWPELQHVPGWIFSIDAIKLIPNISEPLRACLIEAYVCSEHNNPIRKETGDNKEHSFLKFIPIPESESTDARIWKIMGQTIESLTEQSLDKTLDEIEQGDFIVFERHMLAFNTVILPAFNHLLVDDEYENETSRKVLGIINVFRLWSGMRDVIFAIRIDKQ